LGFFRWRLYVHSNPLTSRVYKATIGVLGALIILIGLVLVPLPGPGWLIVLCGIAIVASEFAFAQRLLHWARLKLRAWADWVRRSHWSVGASLGLLTCLIVCGAVWLSIHLTGLPNWTPPWIQHIFLL